MDRLWIWKEASKTFSAWLTSRFLWRRAKNDRFDRSSWKKEMVRVFYKEMWDHAEKSLIPNIFHPSFTFRGSLSPSLVGYEEFAGYVDWVTGVFGQYTTDILALIEEGNRVSGKMRFHGFHRQEVFGVPPSGRHVWWTGMPIFTFDGTKVRDLYVLGDIHGLIGRLRGETQV